MDFRETIELVGKGVDAVAVAVIVLGIAWATVLVVLLVRTFLSFVLELELNGRWPWEHR